MLLELAESMFPEGQGAPKLKAKVGFVTEMTNSLAVNAKKAIGELWKARGYDPKQPEVTVEKLGYPLDQEEAQPTCSKQFGAVGQPAFLTSMFLEVKSICSGRCPA